MNTYTLLQIILYVLTIVFFTILGVFAGYKWHEKQVPQEEEEEDTDSESSDSEEEDENPGTSPNEHLRE